MGLLDRIFGSGKDRALPSMPASSQFHESESTEDDSQPSRNAPRRELVQVILRDTMRKHGIPSDWIDCRILSTVHRSGRPGLHVNFVVRQAHDRLLGYVFAFQDSFERELSRFEPRSGDWLLSLGWEFQGVKAEHMPDPKAWSNSNFAASVPAPLLPASGGTAFARTEDPKEQDANRTDDDIQRDLQQLFAIRDAALAQAARPAAPKDDDQDEGGPPDFQPTQPFDDGGSHRR